MDEVQARQRLGILVQADLEPTLTPEEVDLLLDSARIADGAGLPPSDASWGGTYDFARAAAAGWELKAAKVAARYDLSLPEGQSFSRSQQYDQFIKQAKVYRRRIHTDMIVSVAEPLGEPVSASAE